MNARPFSGVLYSINEQMQTEDVDVPLTKVRPVKKVALVVVTGDRGLCGVFNNAILKKAESRIKELKTLRFDYTIISVAKRVIHISSGDPTFRWTSFSTGATSQPQKKLRRLPTMCSPCL